MDYFIVGLVLLIIALIVAPKNKINIGEIPKPKPKKKVSAAQQKLIDKDEASYQRFLKEVARVDKALRKLNR